MPRFVFATFLACGSLFLQCSTPVQPKHFVVLHSLQETHTRQCFLNGLEEAADSLGIRLSVLDQTSLPRQKAVDSLFSHLDGLAYSLPLNEEIVDRIHRAKKKRIPLVEFLQYDRSERQAVVIDSDSHTLGRAAARFVLEQFGDKGRFAIITPSLQNSISNESIRGFREVIAYKSAWRQLNIIACDSGAEQALKQYRQATRFGNRIIWFIADDCQPVVDQLCTLKKDNFFIAIDLHPNENSVKLLRTACLDAIVTKDFRKIGRLCIHELYRGGQTEQRVVNCGSKLLTSDLTVADVQQNENIF